MAVNNLPGPFLSSVHEGAMTDGTPCGGGRSCPYCIHPARKPLLDRIGSPFSGKKVTCLHRVCTAGRSAPNP